MKTYGRLLPLSIAAEAGMLLFGCGAQTPMEAELSLVTDSAALTDTDPDPDTVAVELVAAVGTKRYLADGEAEVWGTAMEHNPTQR